MNPIAFAVHVVICVLVFLAIRRRDAFRKEPFPALLAAVLLGAGAMWGAYQFLLRHFETSVATPVWSAPLTTGLAEEGGKFLVVLVLFIIGGLGPNFIRRKQWFDEPFDGLIYGGMAGLGAALTEGLVALSTERNSVDLVLQNVVRALLHPLLGSIGAFALGMWTVARRTRPQDTWPSPRRCVFIIAANVGVLGVAVVIHAMWNLTIESWPEALRKSLGGANEIARISKSTGQNAGALIDWVPRVGVVVIFITTLLAWLHLMFLANRWVIFYFPKEERERMCAHCILRWLMAVPRDNIRRRHRARAGWSRSPAAAPAPSQTLPETAAKFLTKDRPASREPTDRAAR